MGFLVRFSDDDSGALECLWEALQIASRPKSPREIRVALGIEDKVMGISTDASMDAAVQCPKCHERSPVQDFGHFNWWRILKTRTLNQAAALFFEEEAFEYLKQFLMEIQPPQPKVRDFAKLWDILDDAEKNWKGEELKLREKLNELALEHKSIEADCALGETA